MNRVRVIGAAVVVVALFAIASASASAAAPEFKPASGSFTSVSGKGTLQLKGGNTITCESDKDSGSITGAKTASVTITFEKCTVFGIVGATSLGDASGIILVKSTGELCIISGTKVGMALTIEPVHIEAAGVLAKVEGVVIGEVTPTAEKTKTGKLLLAQSAGKQAIEKCGSATDTLSGSENEGTAKAAGEETTDTITYEKETEVTN